MLEKIKDATQFLKNKMDQAPVAGIVMGTGLGQLSEEINIQQSFSYDEIPHFPVSTVEGHAGELIYGELGGKMVVAMKGRFHYYEGYDMKEVTFPIRVMKSLGIEYLFLSNASGGMNPEFRVGDIMVLEDHINLFPDNPLRGKNHEELGPRFPDMSEPYDKILVAKALAIAGQHSIILQKGVYVGLAGPTFETPAEYRYLRIIGGDAVGMSTVPETIVARHAGITCFAASVITDLGIVGQIEEVSHEEVMLAAKNAAPKLQLIIRELIAGL